MKNKNWKETAELVGITAIVVSLVFVGLQLNQAEDIANATRRSSVVSNRIELASAINEYADIWRRGNADEKLDDTELVIYENLAWSKFRFHQGEFAAANSLGVVGGMSSHVREMAVFMHENPGARRVWEEQLELVRQMGPVPLSESTRETNRFDASIIATLETLDQSEK
jgi:hypothetical protein